MNARRLMSLSVSEGLGVDCIGPVQTGLSGDTYECETPEEYVVPGSNESNARITDPPCCMHGVNVFSPIGRL